MSAHSNNFISLLLTYEQMYRETWHITIIYCMCVFLFSPCLCAQPDELPHYRDLVQYVANRHIFTTAELMVSW